MLMLLSSVDAKQPRSESAFLKEKLQAALLSVDPILYLDF